MQSPDESASNSRKLQPVRYLLDTNILLAYARGGELMANIEAEFSVISGGPYAPAISIVTAAEIRSIARRNGWGAKKETELAQLLANDSPAYCRYYD